MGTLKLLADLISTGSMAFKQRHSTPIGVTKGIHTIFSLLHFSKCRGFIILWNSKDNNKNISCCMPFL